MAISHLQLVFKEKATGENNHKLKSSECLQFWQDVKGLCPYQGTPLAPEAPQVPFALTPLESVSIAAQTPISNREDMHISESCFSRVVPVLLLCTVISIVGKNSLQRMEHFSLSLRSNNPLKNENTSTTNHLQKWKCLTIVLSNYPSPSAHDSQVCLSREWPPQTMLSWLLISYHRIVHLE